MSEGTATLLHVEPTTEDEVRDWLHARGVRVLEVQTPRNMWGAYSLHRGIVYLRAGMPVHFRVPTLLHEAVHVSRRHEGHQNAAVERYIDEVVARRLIDPIDYAWAETQVGNHTAGLAAELEVPKWVIRAYRRVLVKDVGGLLRR